MYDVEKNTLMMLIINLFIGFFGVQDDNNTARCEYYLESEIPLGGWASTVLWSIQNVFIN